MTTRLPDGSPVEWSCLPFGLAWAPYVFTIALDPLVEAARVAGFMVAKYLDDFVIASPDYSDCDAGLRWLRRELTALGFSVSDAKTSTAPTQDLVFLGLGIDLEEKVFYWPREKALRCAEEAVALIDEAASSGRLRCSAPRLRSFLGRLAFLTSVCPPLALWRRHLERSLGDRLVGSATLDATAVRELRFWGRLDWLLGATFPIPETDSPVYTVRTDASDTGVGIRILFPGGRWLTTSSLLPPDLIGSASATRELYASTLGLEILVASGRPLFRSRVQFVTDSQASAGALRRGARTDAMIVFGRRILGHQLRLGFTATVTWRPREELEAEDAASRVVPAQEAAVADSVLDALCRVLGWRPSFDLFASASNARCSAFAARLPEPAAAAVDGLMTTVVDRTWAFPPFALARRAATHIAAAGGARAALLAPTDVPTNTATWHAILSETEPLTLPPTFAVRSSSPRPLRLLAFHTPPPLPLPADVPLYIGSDPPSLPRVYLPSTTSAVSRMTACVPTQDASHPAFHVYLRHNTDTSLVVGQLRSAFRALRVREAVAVASLDECAGTSATWWHMWQSVFCMRDIAWAVWLRS